MIQIKEKQNNRSKQNKTMKGATQRNIPDTNTMEKRTRINSSSGLSTSLDNPDSIKIHFHLKNSNSNNNNKTFNIKRCFTTNLTKNMTVNFNCIVKSM